MAKGPKPPSKAPRPTVKPVKSGSVPPQSTSNPTGRPPKRGK
jgi:hypothetical protein